MLVMFPSVESLGLVGVDVELSHFADFSDVFWGKFILLYQKCARKRSGAERPSVNEPTF